MWLPLGRVIQINVGLQLECPQDDPGLSRDKWSVACCMLHAYKDTLYNSRFVTIQVCHPQTYNGQNVKLRMQMNELNLFYLLSLYGAAIVEASHFIRSFLYICNTYWQRK